MKITDIPAKFPIPFGASAGGGYIRGIPTGSQIGVHDGWASLTDGFPPLNFSPVASGGVPPFGQDMNGILNIITKWSQWQNAGGIVPYDGTFQSAIGGYPKGARVAATADPTIIYVSLVDDNATNPNTGGADWAVSSQTTSVVGGGTANAITIAPTNGAAAYTDGESWFIKPTTTNTNTAVTLNRNGLGPKTIVNPTADSPAPGAITSGGMIQVIYNLAADKFFLLTTSNSITSLIQSSGYFRIPGTKAIVQWLRYSVTTNRTNNTPSGTMWEVQTGISWPVAMTTMLTAWAACDITNNGNFEFANIVGNATTFDVYATSWADPVVGQPNHGWAIAIGQA